MGVKFYRGADKPKKFRKRFTQTRSWLRTLKWVACKYLIIHQLINFFYFVRSCPPYYGSWSSI